MWPKSTYLILACIAATIIASCGKEEFGQRLSRSSLSIPGREQFSNSSCSHHSMVRPKVDMLFLFDNSTSSFFLNQRNRQTILEALRNTIHTATQRLNYRIMVAPLIPEDHEPSSSSYYTNGISVAAENANGITSNGQRLIVGASDNQLTDRTASILAVSGSNEYGLERAYHLLDYHYRTTKIFRGNAHTLIALFSNEDADWRQDEGPDHQGTGPEKEDFTLNRNNLIALSNRMNALQFRFVTVAPFRDYNSGKCSLPFAKSGARYRKMSNEIYLHNVSSKDDFNPVTSRVPYDTFDLCGQDYQGIFEKITQVLTLVAVPHIYNFWPITDKAPTASGGAPFDSNSIRVFKHTSNTSSTEISESTSNGWSIVTDSNGVPRYYTQNTRRSPSAGESFTGYLIQLHGPAEITYPECIRIETSAPFDYFGYVVSTEKPYDNPPNAPIENNVKYKKNGTLFTKSATNGWEYIGFRRNWNTRIKNASGHTAGLPEVNKTGHIFKLYGNAIYSNGDKVELLVDPAPIR